MKILWSVTLAAAALAMSGCGDDTPSVCQEREQVLASIEQLRSYDLVAQGVDGLEPLIEELVGNLDDLRAAAADEVADDVDAVSAAVSDTRAAISTAATPQAKLAALQTGVADVQAALAALGSSLPECD